MTPYICPMDTSVTDGKGRRPLAQVNTPSIYFRATAHAGCRPRAISLKQKGSQRRAAHLASWLYQLIVKLVTLIVDDNRDATVGQRPTGPVGAASENLWD